MIHQFDLRVYYEDTDFGGIVYYANYLKFIERARSEFVREVGVDQVALKQDEGIIFAVRRVEADYLAPAKYDDQLTVHTTPLRVTGARLVFRQDVNRGDELLFSAIVTIAALNKSGQPTRMPANIRLVLQ